ncbi:MAG: HAMP domain-containing histidine kinase [Sphaerochaeta sp.]|nr:HAMP domain-containing histidine kinase [Sphaerochaeta sp.]
MSQIERKRMIQFVLLMILLYFGIQLAFLGINQVTTRPIPLRQGILRGESVNTNLFVIQGIAQKENTMTFMVKTRKSLGVVAHNLSYPHELRINGNLGKHTDSAYQLIPIHAGETTIEISGKGTEQTFFFVSEAESMQEYLELRLLINAFLFFLHMIVLICCVIYFFVGKNRITTGIFLLFVLSSSIKGLNLAELSSISNALGMSIQTYGVIDAITTAINNILPIYILLLLFDIHIRRLYMVLFGLLTIPFVGFSQNLFTQSHIGHGLFSMLFLCITLLILIYGYMVKKKAALPLMILRLIFVVFTSTYLSIVRGELPVSNAIFFCNYAYLGATLYFVGILVVVIVFYLRYNRNLVLKEKEYERVMLLKGLGHDLKHPVLTAKLNNQYLLEGNLNESERECIHVSLQALRRLEKMIENINCYFNQQHLAEKKERISLAVALQKIEENHTNQTEHTLTIKYAENDCIITINPLNFTRIIDNLTDNAFKYSKAEKKVSISYVVSGHHVLITVEDNGNGLDKNEINKVFDVFYRADENRSVEGLGIGLSVVKHLVESSGGEIGVQSKKNIGTVFTLRFPIE